MCLPHLHKKLQVMEKLIKRRKSEVIPVFLLPELKMYKTHLWASYLLLTTDICHPRAIHSQKAMTNRTAVISPDFPYQLGRILDGLYSGLCQCV